MNRQRSPDFTSLLTSLLDATWFARLPSDHALRALQLQTARQVVGALLRLAVDPSVDGSVRANTMAALDRVYASTEKTDRLAADVRAERRLARFEIEQLWSNPAGVTALPAATVPPGSPIGSTY